MSLFNLSLACMRKSEIATAIFIIVCYWQSKQTLIGKRIVYARRKSNLAFTENASCIKRVLESGLLGVCEAMSIFQQVIYGFLCLWSMSRVFIRQCRFGSFRPRSGFVSSIGTFMRTICQSAFGLTGRLSKPSFTTHFPP